MVMCVSVYIPPLKIGVLEYFSVTDFFTNAVYHGHATGIDTGTEIFEKIERQKNNSCM